MCSNCESVRPADRHSEKRVVSQSGGGQRRRELCANLRKARGVPWLKPESSQRFWCRTWSDTAGLLAPMRIGHWRACGRCVVIWLTRLSPSTTDVVKRTGDGSLVEFRSVVDAVRCAVEVQNGMVERNAGLPPERRIEFRVGWVTSSRKAMAI
jgi:class 3 adenylate cyclase